MDIEQREDVDIFLKGKDVFVCLPKGSGKSAGYEILPSIVCCFFV